MKRLLLKFMLLVFAMIINMGEIMAVKITDYTNIVSGKKYYIGATTTGVNYYFQADGSTLATGVAGNAVAQKSNGTIVVFEGSGSSWSIKFYGTTNYLSLSSKDANGLVDVVSSAEVFTASNVDSKIRLTINGHALEKYSTKFGSYKSTQADVWLEPVDDVAKYAVTIETPLNGSLAIKNGANVISSGDQVEDGTTLTAFLTPNTGYAIYNWQATDASNHTYTKTYTYTVNGHDVTFKANFGVPVTISSIGYTTYFRATDAVKLPNGVEGYVAYTDNEGFHFEKAYNANAIVPAGTAVVLKGAEGDYSLLCSTGGTAPEKNDLIGAAADMTDAEMATANPSANKFYALSLDENDQNPGFYWIEDDGAAFAISAGKAYLAMSSSASAKTRFVFDEDGEATAIESVETVKGNSAAYNLNGQRVNANAKGIVIINGKKFYNK